MRSSPLLRYPRRVAGSPPGGTAILLPGAELPASAFEAHGFVATFQEIHPSMEVICPDVPLESYLDQTTVHYLQTRVFDEGGIGRAAGPLWYAGISLGAQGALGYARAYPGRVDRIFLLAPFLGSRGLIASVEAAGGLRQWAGLPASVATAEEAVLRWLGRYAASSSWPELHLGFGRDDRFAASHHLLAALLPGERVTIVDGAHDWASWEVLWPAMLRSAEGDRLRTPAHGARR